MRALIAGSLGASACYSLVQSDLDNLRCLDEGRVGPPACQVGRYCAAGACVTCQGAEVCGDALDNDCNGVVNDGCRLGAEGGQAGASAAGQASAAGAGGEAGSGGSGGGSSRHSSRSAARGVPGRPRAGDAHWFDRGWRSE